MTAQDRIEVLQCEEQTSQVHLRHRHRRSGLAENHKRKVRSSHDIMHIYLCHLLAILRTAGEKVYNRTEAEVASGKAASIDPALTWAA